MTKRKILLTGASGNVGRLLRPLLHDEFAIRLAGRGTIEPEYEGEESMPGDIADPAYARAAVEGTDGVIHLAGLVAPAVSFEDTLDPNYRGVLNLLEACRHQGVRRFVFASSHHIVGLHPSSKPIDEIEPVAPDGFYGLSKVFGEAACTMYARRFGISTLILRIGNADPEVVDGRRERLWVSGRDLAQLIRIGLTSESLGCEVVYGVSNCPDPMFTNENAHRLGYRPEDHASEHRAAGFRPLSAIQDTEGRGYVGGYFAVNQLPSIAGTMPEDGTPVGLTGT